MTTKIEVHVALIEPDGNAVHVARHANVEADVTSSDVADALNSAATNAASAAMSAARARKVS